ncbi:MAG: hypothetical protein IIW13_02525 [Paludibacteraceae bacterium]|nr:hypothetical protein [Bacteroidales bacterium]MBQ5778845.1 hypothetical protein [Paludibacteraceae bacterium]
MPYNPKSLLNLKGRRGKGRPLKTLSALKNIPKEAQAEIYQALWTALTHDNFQEAKKYLESVNIPNYGFIIQIVLRELADKKTSWRCVNDILDRLFGKAQIMITSDKDAPTFKIEFVKNEEEDNENDEG